MKKILIAIAIFVLATNCKAQIIPVENKLIYIDEGNGMPEGSYFKDLNNLFDKYIGTWKGTYDNKNYIFYVAKSLKSNEVFAEDYLTVHYLITTISGSVLEDSKRDLNPMRGDYFSEKADYYNVRYAGKKDCGQYGTFYLRPKSTTSMYVNFIPENILLNLNECPNGRAIIHLPSKGMYVTKYVPTK